MWLITTLLNLEFLMRLTSIVLIFLILFSCEKDSYHHILIFGHAGMGLSMQNSIYHDNSFEAVELCLSIPGSNGVEVDVQMDRDGCLWLYHDEHLDDKTNLTGCINDCSTSKLETAYYKTLKKEKLVKLNTIISILNNDQKLFLDIKSTNACSGNLIETIQFLERIVKFN
jgi:glycerophosphoryl diester phosphodiesterase